MQVKTAFGSFSVSDIGQAKEFYVSTLNMQCEDRMGGLDLDVAGMQVHVYEKSDHVPAVFTVLNLVVEDINQAVDDLVERGVTFERYENMPGQQDERGVMRGKDVNMGPNIAWFKDPSGNILSVLEV